MKVEYTVFQICSRYFHSGLAAFYALSWAEQVKWIAFYEIENKLEDERREHVSKQKSLFSGLAWALSFMGRR